MSCMYTSCSTPLADDDSAFDNLSNYLDQLKRSLVSTHRFAFFVTVGGTPHPRLGQPAIALLMP